MSKDYIKFIISKYKINDTQEIRAIKLYYFWVVNRRKYFPEMVHSKFSKTKDPRSTSIFKYCYKLQRESVLEEKDYENYIKSQLIVLKYFSKKYNRDLIIDANCITGDKAWKRWKLFETRLKKSKNNSVDSCVILPNLFKLEKELVSTKEFLFTNIGEINKENITKNIQNILYWFNLRKISPYFVCMNKYIREIYNIEEIRNKFKIDPILYDEKVNDIIRKLYYKIFKKER